MVKVTQTIGLQMKASEVKKFDIIGLKPFVTILGYLTQLSNYENLPSGSLRYPGWILSSLYAIFPEVETIIHDRNSMIQAIDSSQPVWTDHFTGTTTQIILKWINPDFTARATNFIIILDRICREELPVIHLGQLFLPSVSITPGFNLFS